MRILTCEKKEGAPLDLHIYHPYNIIISLVSILYETITANEEASYLCNHAIHSLWEEQHVIRVHPLYCRHTMLLYS